MEINDGLMVDRSWVNVARPPWTFPAILTSTSQTTTTTAEDTHNKKKKKKTHNTTER